ncbi:MAG: PAS domain-containing protein [Fimbriimonadaceae bacterium]|nr:PAS domain-containing protein [Fimbriimonadaceae bacterium]
MSPVLEPRPKTVHQLQREVTPTGVERTFGPEEVIVSKTDLKGHITYANEVFCRVAGYDRADLIGAPHSIVRHPGMPRCVFKLLWETIAEGREIFAYVKNMARTGDHYWVFAHVTPTFDNRHQIIGYHSNRRSPARRAIQFFEPIYAELCEIERRHSDRRLGLEASFAHVVKLLQSQGISYDELVFSVTPD